MTVGTAVLLPVFLLFALFAAWVVYLQANAVNVLVVCVALAMPAVMYTGCRGAGKQSEPVLRAYSFALTMVITMQLSMTFVAWFDDGTLWAAYVDSCAVGFSSMCSNMENLPMGADWLNVEEICACASSSTEDWERRENITNDDEVHR